MYHILSGQTIFLYKLTRAVSFHQSPTDYHKRQTMYLSLLSLCLFGISTASPAPEATPEADPYLIHGYGGLGYPYTYGYNPYFVPTVVKSAQKEDSTETMEDDTKTV